MHMLQNNAYILLSTVHYTLVLFCRSEVDLWGVVLSCFLTRERGKLTRTCELDLRANPVFVV